MPEITIKELEEAKFLRDSAARKARFALAIFCITIALCAFTVTYIIGALITHPRPMTILDPISVIVLAIVILYLITQSRSKYALWNENKRKATELAMKMEARWNEI